MREGAYTREMTWPLATFGTASRVAKPRESAAVPVTWGAPGGPGGFRPWAP